jgi:hypothetical protein
MAKSLSHGRLSADVTSNALSFQFTGCDDQAFFNRMFSFCTVTSVVQRCGINVTYFTFVGKLRENRKQTTASANSVEQRFGKFCVLS